MFGSKLGRTSSARRSIRQYLFICPAFEQLESRLLFDALIATPQSVLAYIDTPKFVALEGRDSQGRNSMMADADALTFEIVTGPQHGLLGGTMPILTYTPAPGYVGTDSFTFTASDGISVSELGAVTIDVASWTAPVGVPEPQFGLNETHMMYAGEDPATPGQLYTYDYGSGPEPYRIGPAGPYTHYIDNTYAGATDSGNPFGTPDHPRVTIPLNLPAGSVVEIHGGPYNYTVGGILPISGTGTEAAPIFIRGTGNGTRPRFDTRIGTNLTDSEYIIVEHIDAIRFTIGGGNHHHIALRHSEIRGDLSQGGVAIYSGTAEDPQNDILIFSNIIHHGGDIDSEYDQDVTGVSAGSHSTSVWILDNEISYLSGSGVQVGGWYSGDLGQVHHVYASRNDVHSVRQSGVWCKQASDVIFSENHIYDIINTSWSPSKGAGFQYGPENVWLLNNHIHSNYYGISSGSNSGGNGQDQYVIGNLIHDIHYGPDAAYDPNTAWTYAGIMLVGGTNRHIAYNTIYDVSAGINGPDIGVYEMVNNIIYGITEPEGHHVFIERGEAAASVSDLRNSILYQQGEPVRIRWGSAALWDVAGFQAEFGKGAGTMEADPLFVDPDNGNFHLSYPSAPASPAVDAGAVTDYAQVFFDLYGLSIDVDFDGNPRTQMSGPDIGAFEAGNTAPVANNNSGETSEDTAVVTVNVLDNDTDANGHTLSIAAFTQAAYGTVVDNGDGTFTYTPAADWYGVDSFTYTAADGYGGEDTATVTITVNAANDDPEAVADAKSTDEDVALTFNAQQLADNDSDVDEDALTVTGFTQPSHGTVVDNGNGTWTYAPNGDYFGQDSFTYTVSDGNGGSAEGTVTVTVDAVNDAPSAQDDNGTTDEDIPVTVDVLANDADVDGDSLGIAAFTQGSHGVVTSNGDGTLRYAPAANWYGTDTFTYTVSDGNGGTDTATVTVVVDAVNDAPTASGDSATTDEDIPVNIDVLNNDTDVESVSLSIAGFTQGSHGVVTSNGDGTLNYAPDADWFGTDSFTYTVSDGNGGSAEGTVTVTVETVNDAPVAQDDQTPLTFGQTLTIRAADLLSNDSDADGDQLEMVAVTATAGTHGTVSLADGIITFTPDGTYAGEASFEYTISDGHGGQDSATVTVAGIALPFGQGAAKWVSYTDDDGDTVFVSLRGAGSGVVVFMATGNVDAKELRLDGTTNRSSLTVSVRRAGDGDGQTTVEDIVVEGSIRSITGKTTDLLGNVTVEGLLGSLFLDDLAGGNQIEINTAGLSVSARDKATLRFDEVADTGVNAHGLPIGSLRATEWLNEGAAEQIVAPWVGRLTITGRRANWRRGIEAVDGDFQADLTLTGATSRGVALGSAKIAGQSNGAWSLTGGSAGKIVSGSTAAEWTLAVASTVRTLYTTSDLAGAASAQYFRTIKARGDFLANVSAAGVDTRGTSIGSVSAGSAKDAVITAAGGIGSISVYEWIDGADVGEEAGTIDAGWVGKLYAKGKRSRDPAQVIAGDFHADVILDGEHLPAGKYGLYYAGIAGEVNCLWDIEGAVRTIKAGSTGSDWTLDAEGDVRYLHTRTGLAGSVSAWTFGKIYAKGDLTAKITAEAANPDPRKGMSIDALVAGSVRDVTVTAPGGIGYVSVYEWVDGEDVGAEAGAINAGWLGKLYAKGRRSRDPAQVISGDFEADVILDGDHLPAGKAALYYAGIAGSVPGGLWDIGGVAGRLWIGGDVGSVGDGGAVTMWTARMASLVSLTLGNVHGGDVEVDDALRSVKALRWANGRLEADSIGALSVTGGKGVGAVSGDFGADVTVNGTGVAENAFAVGKVAVSGDLTNSDWKVGGNVRSFVTAGTAQSSSLRSSGGISAIDLGATSASDFLAGVDVLSTSRRAETDGDFVNGGGAIGSVNIRGVGPSGSTERFFEDSNLSAVSFGSIRLKNIDFDTGQSGFRASNGGEAPAFGSVSYADTETGQTWSWKSANTEPIPAPSGFFQTV